MADRPLAPEEERTLAAVLSLASYRTFDGNEPAGVHGLIGQMIGLRADDSSRGWRLELIPGDTTPVDLPDGPIPGRYFAGADRAIEIVISVASGRLSAMELVAQSDASLTRWPTPGELTVM